MNPSQDSIDDEYIENLSREVYQLRKERRWPSRQGGRTELLK